MLAGCVRAICWVQAVWCRPSVTRAGATLLGLPWLVILGLPHSIADWPSACALSSSLLPAVQRAVSGDLSLTDAFASTGDISGRLMLRICLYLSNHRRARFIWLLRLLPLILLSLQSAALLLCCPLRRSAPGAAAQ